MKPSHAVVTIRRHSPAKGDSDSVRVDIDISFNVSPVSVVLSCNMGTTRTSAT